MSGGLTLLGLAGIEIPVSFLDRIHVFAEGRLGNTSDLWKRKGGSFQMDQVDGVTGMGGVRVRVCLISATIASEFCARTNSSIPTTTPGTREARIRSARGDRIWQILYACPHSQVVDEKLER